MVRDADLAAPLAALLGRWQPQNGERQPEAHRPTPSAPRPHHSRRLAGAPSRPRQAVASALPGLMVVANNAHSIAEPDGGAGRPFVNWSVEFGDLRAAHFFGMHAVQALPLLGFLLDRAIGGNQPSALVATARHVVIAIGMAWLIATGALLGIALLGRPIMAL